jgi:hypothetical protein
MEGAGVDLIGKRKKEQKAAYVHLAIGSTHGSASAHGLLEQNASSLFEQPTTYVHTMGLQIVW